MSGQDVEQDVAAEALNFAEQRSASWRAVSANRDALQHIRRLTAKVRELERQGNTLLQDLSDASVLKQAAEVRVRELEEELARQKRLNVRRQLGLVLGHEQLQATEAENAKLREALERIADNHMECLPDCIEGPPTCGCEKRIAQAALADPLEVADRVRELEAENDRFMSQNRDFSTTTDALIASVGRAEARVQELEAQNAERIAERDWCREDCAKLREAMNLAEHELVMGGGTTKPIINAAHILRAALADPFLPIGHPTC